MKTTAKNDLQIWCKNDEERRIVIERKIITSYQGIGTSSNEIVIIIYDTNEWT